MIFYLTRSHETYFFAVFATLREIHLFTQAAYVVNCFSNLLKNHCHRIASMIHCCRHLIFDSPNARKKGTNQKHETKLDRLNPKPMCPMCLCGEKRSVRSVCSVEKTPQVPVNFFQDDTAFGMKKFLLCFVHFAG